MFWGIHGKCCKLHDFVRVAVEVEGSVPHQIQGLKLSAPILAQFPQVIRDVRFGIQLRRMLYKEATTAGASRVLGMFAKRHKHL